MANDTYSMPSPIPGMSFVYDKASDDPVGVTTPDGKEVKFGGSTTPAAIVSALQTANTEQKAAVTEELLAPGNGLRLNGTALDLSYPPVRSVVGSTDTITAVDAGCVVRYSNATATTVTLPAASTAGFGLGFAFQIQNKGGPVTITPATSTIDGSATLVIPKNFGALIYSDGTNYFIDLAGGGANLLGYYPAGDKNSLAVGDGAIAGMTAGARYNIGLGSGALNKVTSGVQNTAIGREAGYGVTTTNYNTLVGFQAGWQPSGGLSQCVAVGVAALRDTSGANNLGLGFQAGKTISTGQDNIAIGSNAGNGNATTGNSNILIGSSADTPAAGASKWVRVGPILVDGNKPAVASGFGAGPIVDKGTSNAAFTVVVGTSPGSSGVINFTNAAPNGWAVDAFNSTSHASLVVVAVPTSTTSVTLYSYSRTTGALTAFNAGDVLVCKAVGY